MPTLRDLIDDGRVHVLDGAMGTMLYSRGMFVNVCYDELNLSQPALVQEVHEAYVQAGAEILETNTFGANPVKLSSHGLEDDTEIINRSAVALARRAAEIGLGDSADLELIQRVLAGPFGQPVHRLGDLLEGHARLLLPVHERVDQRRRQHPAEVADDRALQAASAGSSRTTMS